MTCSFKMDKKWVLNSPYSEYTTVNLYNFDDYFYAPGLKGPPGASNNRIVRPSVHPSVCLSVCLSVRNSVPLTNKVQYLKFWWWYSNHTWAVSSSMGFTHFTDIICPWGWGGVRMLDLEDFAIFWLCCRRGHPCFTNTCLVPFLF